MKFQEKFTSKTPANDLIFLPASSPRLNPIEKVYEYLKWTIFPIVVEHKDEFRGLVQDTFKQITERVGSAN